jgi:hypothetical protein
MIPGKNIPGSYLKISHEWLPTMFFRPSSDLLRNNIFSIHRVLKQSRSITDFRFMFFQCSSWFCCCVIAPSGCGECCRYFGSTCCLHSTSKWIWWVPFRVHIKFLFPVGLFDQKPAYKQITHPLYSLRLWRRR